MQAGSITATPRVDQMQDHRQRQEDAGAVETAEVHPCSLETILARTGTKAPRSPGFGTRRQAGALASAQVTLGGLQLWSPRGQAAGLQVSSMGIWELKGRGALRPPFSTLMET